MSNLINKKVNTSSNGSEERERVGRKVERYLVTATTTSEAGIRLCYLHLHHFEVVDYNAIFCKEEEGESKSQGDEWTRTRENSQRRLSNVLKMETSPAVKNQWILFGDSVSKTFGLNRNKNAFCLFLMHLFTAVDCGVAHIVILILNLKFFYIFIVDTFIRFYFIYLLWLEDSYLFIFFSFKRKYIFISLYKNLHLINRVIFYYWTL